MSGALRALTVVLALATGAAAQHPQIRLRPVPPAERVEPGGKTTEAEPDRVAELIVELTNELRHRDGIRPLEVEPTLAKAAASFAHFMATDDKYGHTADGRRPAERIEAAGYEYCLVEENIAWLVQTRGFTSAGLARQLMDDWEASPEHRRNLLNPHLGQIGVAIARSPKTGRYYAVQEFGRPLSERIDFEIGNATDEPLRYLIDGRPFSLEARFRRIHKRSLPPRLEIAGSTDSSERPIAWLPVTGDRFLVRRGSDERLAIDVTHADRSKPAGTTGDSASAADASGLAR